MIEWIESPLEDLVVSPITYGVVKPGPEKENGVLFVRGGDISNGKISITKLRTISDEVSQQYSRTLLKGNELLISLVGNPGQVAISPKELVGANIARQVGLIRLSDQISTHFVKYFLMSSIGKEKLFRQTGGSVQQVINLRELRTVKIPLPPLPEQRAIAGVLSSLDDKIDLLHRQNKTLEALAQTLFRQWFIEEAEDDWEDGVLPDEFDFTMGLSPPGTSYNEEGTGIPMFQGKADFTFRFPRKRVFTTEPKRFAEKFDTLISVRAPVGAQNMALERCCIGRGVAAFCYKRNNQYFSYTYNKLNSIMAEIQQFEDSGTVFGSINKSDFQSLVLILPPIELVDKFESEVGLLDKKIYRNCQQIRTLEELRDSLLPKLISGNVRAN